MMQEFNTTDDDLYMVNLISLVGLLVADFENWSNIGSVFKICVINDN